MRQATIEFTGCLVVDEDGDEWEGDDLPTEDARDWVSHGMARGDKHAGGYRFYGASITGVTYEDVADDVDE